MRISKEYLTLLRNSQRQLEHAHIVNQFITENLKAEYKLMPEDSLDMETGEISRAKGQKLHRKSRNGLRQVKGQAES